MAPSLGVIQTSNNDHIAVAEIAAASAASELWQWTTSAGRSPTVAANMSWSRERRDRPGLFPSPVSFAGPWFLLTAVCF